MTAQDDVMGWVGVGMGVGMAGMMMNQMKRLQPRSRRKRR